MAEHTPGPLVVKQTPNLPSVYVGTKDFMDDMVCSMLGESAQDWANAERLAACYNACEGMNPEAMRHLFAVCKALIASAARNVAATSDWVKAVETFIAVADAAIIKAEES